MAAFKHFDPKDTGSVDPDVFANVIDKLGFTISTKQVSAYFNSIEDIFDKSNKFTFSYHMVSNVNVNRNWKLYFQSMQTKAAVLSTINNLAKYFLRVQRKEAIPNNRQARNHLKRSYPIPNNCRFSETALNLDLVSE